MSRLGPYLKIETKNLKPWHSKTFARTYTQRSWFSSLLGKKESKAKHARPAMFIQIARAKWPCTDVRVGHQRDWAPNIDASELWRWRKLLRVSWTARRSSQSILKEISPEYWLEGLMQKLKLQYFGHLMQMADSLEKTLMLGKIEGRRRRRDRSWDGWMASLTQRTWVWATSRRWWTGKPGMLQSMGSQSQTQLSNWTTKKNSLADLTKHRFLILMPDHVIDRSGIGQRFAFLTSSR